MSFFFAPERFETDTFTLRSYLPGDGPALCEATNSSYEHLRTFMAWATESDTVEANEERARRFRANLLTHTDYTIGAWAPDGSRLLGGTGFHPRGRAWSDGVAEIGMWVRADAAGRGLGTEMLQAMLRWGFTEWPWERLSWHCDERNLASQRCAQKAGMTLEGQLRGDKPEVGEGRRTTQIYGMIRSEVNG